MEKSVKISKKQLQKLIRESIQEQLELSGKQEAENAMIDWFEIANPHGATKTEFAKFFDKLDKKYGRGAIVDAFNSLYKDKKWLKYVRTPRGKEIFVFKKS